MLKKLSLLLFLIIIFVKISLGIVFIPMNDSQKNHLKAYGVVYQAVSNGIKSEWLLNYKGGSFIIFNNSIKKLADEFGISYSIIKKTHYEEIIHTINNNNMNKIPLEKTAKIAVYIPPDSNPWDDAVTLVLEYANIPYDKIWDKEILNGNIYKYDWLHLHHEDFTGQYGKFLAYKHTTWYMKRKKRYKKEARKLGFKKVSELKLSVAMTIRDFINKGGFLFSMCSATDTLDIALSAENTDIVPAEYDGDPVDSNFKEKLNYSKTLAFKNFDIYPDPYKYEFSTIDTPRADKKGFTQNQYYFELFEFSAKIDVVPTTLTQNHKFIIKDFVGQTTSFTSETIKDRITVLGRYQKFDEAKYIMGKAGKGFFVFLGGHDPEDFVHRIGDPKTKLKYHRNSPGYRLILNNVLFPSIKKKPLKT
ncbi:MAG: asparagine synthetase B [Candidatus Mcinerneyibacterium aminivorans]|uniref:Asparagine synthetase B n=1 Tax=Candidatus Mcinerneyibacterium aminivorans TaxID=2703815 RepID=A0A5D0MNJ3_9BACT|nr:MAG: asparagine synthetase B [Candidatus Mcinerneyibacterium aminivorans]